MNTRALVLAAVFLGLAGCGDESKLQPIVATHMVSLEGDGQAGVPGSSLPQPLRVLVTDDEDNPVPGVVVNWSVIDGGGSITPTSTTDATGTALATFTLGAAVAEQHAQAQVSGSSLAPVIFSATATGSGGNGIVVLGGGN